MPTPEDTDTNRAESSNTSNPAANPGPSTEPSISGIHESTQQRPDNARRTEIYTDNPGHASHLTDEERQRLEALAADSSAGAIFVTYDLVHRIDTLIADGTRRTDEALMQYLFQDDIWEAVDIGGIDYTETPENSRDRNGNGDSNGGQGGESELKLTNGTGEGHEEELKQQSDI
ncbi:uncharacterized protein N7479_008800 [Penicillium vulpinum]|uniref:Uncharacterized protein n=1 Tax=Penicillium vulpinum TaxID=29845 RepID=A0A1V6S0T9_9EURO|nr:uncharacterized protein N7479_008800 [Penicillium vulpinum]KAJ5950387.1 hypothetical protein N7479_008800 [Penicillium vulpinum]OQE07635.1 hypothetical protein PENVUL_c012G02654 [Penicillium vulpinum]